MRILVHFTLELCCYKLELCVLMYYSLEIGCPGVLSTKALLFKLTVCCWQEE